MKRYKIFCAHLIAFSFMMPAISMGQQPKEHPKKTYVGEDGKVYWNKALPVYIQLSSDPQSADKSVTLKGLPAYARYTEPYYFDTEGANYIRTRWAVDKETGRTVEPKVEILWEVFSDSKSPKTAVSYGDATTYRSDGKVYAGQNLQVTLASSDKTSGVEQVFYSLDGGAFQSYSSPISLSSEKEYNLKYYAVDNVGNAEEIKEAIIQTDLTAPVTAQSYDGSFAPGQNVVSSRGKIVLSATDEGSGLSKTMVSLDGRAESTYKYPISASYLKEGEHKLTYYSIDKNGNKEEPKELTFFVDKSAPMVSSEMIGDSFVTTGGKQFSSGRAQIKLVAIDNKAGVDEIFYSVNGKSYEKYEKPFTLQGGAGNYSVRYYAVDKVGNSNKNKAAASNSGNISIPYLDLTGPSLSHSYSGPKYTRKDTIFISSKTEVKLFASDRESGVSKITYKINGGTETTYQKPFNLSNEGMMTVEITGYDNVNNTNKKEFLFVVDMKGPKIIPTLSIEPITETAVEGKPMKVYSNNVALFLSAVDNRVGYNKMYYSFEGSSSEKLYTGAIKGFKQNSNLKVHFRALDYLGNEDKGTIEFRVE
ncbi:MAG: hypothetical protein AAFX87_11000 [Bacteroidota bacterium]